MTNKVSRFPGTYIITATGDMVPERTFWRDQRPRNLALELVKLVGEEVALDHVKVSAHLIRAIEEDRSDEELPS